MGSDRDVRNDNASGITGELSRLKSNGGAAAEELREFIEQIHAKSPKEILSTVAESSLVRGIAVSAFGIFVLLAVFTIIPYLMNRGAVDIGANATAGGKAAARSEPEQVQPDNVEPGADSSAVGDAGKTDIEKATTAMGIDEIKTADPGENPLDKKLDSLLDGVD